MSDAYEASLNTSLLKPGRNCWRVEQSSRAALIVDAEDYYRLALHAMLAAKSQIMIIGWDVDTRIKLVDERPPGGAPRTLGPLLSWLSKHRPELEIYILVWDHAALSIPGRGTTALRLARWAMNKRIHVKFDSSHPLAASHHQKILVIDDALAFCGGIDITADRWDTRAHRDEEPGRRRPFTRRRYGPWHDASMAVDRNAAEAIGDLARVRWKIATGEDVPVPPARSEPWPSDLEANFHDVEIAVARTRGKQGTLKEIREIEALFVDLIKCAKRFVYVETQYFASRVIAEAIGKRLSEPDCPEFVVVNPRTAYGWLDEAAMSPARYELMKALAQKDKNGRFRIYSPVTEGGEDIYVHAKIMIVDDHYLRVGSANMNNRSMGLDSECDLLIDGTQRTDVRDTIARIRTDLLAEHLGLELKEVERCFEKTGSLIGCIEKLRGNGRTLKPLEHTEPTKIEKGIAKRELADPETADPFEPYARPGLLKGVKKGS